MGLSRRQLLVGAGIAGAALLGGLHLRQFEAREIVARILARRLPNAAMSAADLDRFAADFTNFDRTSAAKLAVLDEVLPVIESEVLAAVLPARARVLFERYERRLITAFIQSTDFDLSERRQTVRYLAINDPAQRGCTNRLFQPAPPR